MSEHSTEQVELGEAMDGELDARGCIGEDNRSVQQWSAGGAKLR